MAFHDVFGLDDDLLAMLPQPITAVILLFPGGVKEDQSSPPALPDGSPFFLYQVKGLGNACGTIASVHAVANSPAAAGLAPGSALKAFLDANA